MLKSIFAALCLSVLVAGCSGGDGGGSPDGQDNVGEFGAADLGYNPTSRWPQRGSFQYNIDYSYNGNRCKAQKQFNSRAAYCLGLQDQTLNNSCALEVRKTQYRNDCGNDFQEINFSSRYWRSGYDPILRKQCETGRGPSKFKTNKQYCEFLKDESQHNSCFWASRHQEYLDLNCPGNFSPEPRIEIPPTEPPTDPTTPPENPKPPVEKPPTDPLDMIPVVRDLRAAGIIVIVDWRAIRDMNRYPMPGDLPLDQQMKILWQELESNKAAIIARKSSIRTIEVTIYTNYRDYHNQKNWYVDFETAPGDLAQYFPLFDKIQNFVKLYNIDFDLIHSGYRTDRIAYKPLRDMIATVETNAKDMGLMSGMFSEIKTNSYSHYNANSRSLTLKRDEIASEFKKYIALLKPIAPVYTWAANHGINISADFDEDKIATVQASFATLEKYLPSLEYAAQANMLKEITIYFTSVEVHYFNSLKNLSLSLEPGSAKTVSALLQAFGTMAKFAYEGKVKISYFSSTLNQDFVTGVSVLEKVWPKLKPKASGLDEITLADNTRYYESLKELTIGSKTPLKETEAIIAKIK